LFLRATADRGARVSSAGEEIDLEYLPCSQDRPRRNSAPMPALFTKMSICRNAGCRGENFADGPFVAMPESACHPARGL
jgi:hypothetical protein